MAVESHQENLSKLVAQALYALPNAPQGDFESKETDAWLKLRSCDGKIADKSKPDFVSVTRGPGMRASLSAGLDVAKGLAVAWQIPLLGVNHMQAHALTPRLVSTLHARTSSSKGVPEFPFLSLLVSGGHTLLVYSEGLCVHKILASTIDIAIGDAIDKMARDILPSTVLQGSNLMYGQLLERFASSDVGNTKFYMAPKSRAEEIARNQTQWGWSLPSPLADTKSMKFSFSGLGSAVKRICDRSTDMGEAERQCLAREAFRLSFEHLASRATRAIEDLEKQGKLIKDLVVSGGVASNEFLRSL